MKHFGEYPVKNDEDNTFHDNTDFSCCWISLASAVLLQSLLGVLVSLACIAFCVYSFYIKTVQKRKSQYPLVPPEGKPDMYVPRTNIPRPVVEDFRRLEEKKRKFAKIRKLVSKRVQRSKK